MNDFKDYLNTVGQEKYEAPSFLDEGLFDNIKKKVQNFKDKHDHDSEHTYYALKIDLSRGETITRLVNDAVKKQAAYKKAGTDKSLDDCAKESLTELYEKLMQYVRESAENNKTIKKYIFSVQPKNTALYVWFTENTKFNREKNVAARDLKQAIDAFQDPYRIDNDSLILIHDTFSKGAALDLKNRFGLPKDDAEIKTKVADTAFQNPITTAIEKLSDKISEAQKKIDDKELNGEEVEICYIAWPINKEVLKTVFATAKSTDKPEVLYANYINKKLAKAKLITTGKGTPATRSNDTNGYYGLSYTKTGLRLYFKFTKQVKDIQTILTEEEAGVNTKIITAKRGEAFLNQLDVVIKPDELTSKQVYNNEIKPAFSAGKTVYRLNIEMDKGSVSDFRDLILNKKSIDDVKTDDVKKFIQDTLGATAKKYAKNEFLGFSPAINTKTADGTGLYMWFNTKDSRESVKETIKGILSNSRITTSECNLTLNALEALSKTVGDVEFKKLIEVIREIASSGICNTKKYSVIKVSPTEDDLKQWVGDVQKIKEFDNTELVKNVKELCDKLTSTYKDKFAGMTFVSDSIEFFLSVEKDDLDAAGKLIQNVFTDIKVSAESLRATEESIKSFKDNIKDNDSIAKTLALLVRDITENRADLADANTEYKAIAFKIVDNKKLAEYIAGDNKVDFGTDEVRAKTAELLKNLTDKIGEKTDKDYLGWYLTKDSMVLVFSRDVNAGVLDNVSEQAGAILNAKGTIGKTNLSKTQLDYLNSTKNLHDFTDGSAMSFVKNFMDAINGHVAENKDNAFHFDINFEDIIKMRYIDVADESGSMNDGVLGDMLTDSYKPEGFGKYLSEYLYNKFNVTMNEANASNSTVVVDDKVVALLSEVKSIAIDDHNAIKGTDTGKKDKAEQHTLKSDHAKAIIIYYMSKISDYVAAQTKKWVTSDKSGKTSDVFDAKAEKISDIILRVHTKNEKVAEKLKANIDNVSNAKKNNSTGGYYFKTSNIEGSKV